MDNPLNAIEGFFNKHIWNAITLFIIASILSVVFIFVADFFDPGNGRMNKVWNNTWTKLSDAFTMIAAASLTGAAYIILGEIRQTCKPV